MLNFHINCQQSWHKITACGQNCGIHGDRFSQPD